MHACVETGCLVQLLRPLLQHMYMAYATVEPNTKLAMMVPYVFPRSKSDLGVGCACAVAHTGRIHTYTTYCASHAHTALNTELQERHTNINKSLLRIYVPNRP